MDFSAEIAVAASVVERGAEMAAAATVREQGSAFSVRVGALHLSPPGRRRERRGRARAIAALPRPQEASSCPSLARLDTGSAGRVSLTIGEFGVPRADWATKSAVRLNVPPAQPGGTVST